MLISKIQQDLFDFIKEDPQDEADLIQFWYQANSNALSAALTKQDGLKLIVNLENFDYFEQLSKRLFLITDTIIVRDTRKLTIDEIKPAPSAIFIEDYKPNYYDSIAGELQLLRPSPFTLQYAPSAYWSSTSKVLNNGYKAGYAMDITQNPIPDNYIKWLTASGKDYLQTGQVVYAPFIPPIEMEMELIKANVSLPETFNATSSFYNQIKFIDQKALQALIKLNIPYLDNIDIGTIFKIKQDNLDAYTAFSDSILYALMQLKGMVGSANFDTEVKHLQTELIDDKVATLTYNVRKLKNSRALKKMGLIIGVGAATASIIKPEYAEIAAIGGLAPALIDLITDMRKAKVIPEHQPYFLWQLQNANK